MLSPLTSQVLNKKVHSNPKYGNVKGTLNTGKTAKSVVSVSKSRMAHF